MATQDRPQVESTSTRSPGRFVEALQRNARSSFAELGRKIGLSTPAVAERVHRLEEAGVITGYHASLDSAKLGVPDSRGGASDNSRRRIADQPHRYRVEGAAPRSAAAIASPGPNRS